MINQLLNQIYVPDGWLNFRVELSKEEMSGLEPERFTYQLIYGFSKPNPAIEDQAHLTDYLNNNLDQIESTLLLSIFMIRELAWQDQVVQIAFNRKGLQDKLKVIQMDDYIHDRNVSRLFEMDRNLRARSKGINFDSN